MLVVRYGTEVEILSKYRNIVTYALFKIEIKLRTCMFVRIIRSNLLRTQILLENKPALL